MGKTTHRPRNGEKVSSSETPVTAVDARAVIAVPVLQYLVGYMITRLVIRILLETPNALINARIVIVKSYGCSVGRRQRGATDLPQASCECMFHVYID